jgi:hypothetical protein
MLALKKMRKIKYEQLPCVGEGTIPVEGDTVQFVLDLPYLFTFDHIPPIEVLNDIFKSGLEDAGMSGGCQWKPFEISHDEYNELVQALQNIPDEKHKVVKPPNWVKNKTDWHIWKNEYEIGIPSDEHSKLWKETDKWEKLEKEAREKEDNTLSMEYQLKVIEASNKLTEFMRPYIDKYHKKKNIC